VPDNQLRDIGVLATVYAGAPYPVSR